MTKKHAKASDTRNIEALSMRAAIAPGTIDAKARTVEVVWTTGARVLRGPDYDRFYEELSLDPAHVRMGALNDGAPVLDTHSQWDLRSVIGVVVSANLTPTEGRAVLRYAKDPASDEIFQKIADGIIRKVSVGYKIHRLEMVEESADGVPVYRATDWEPMELSMVPIGADPGGSVRNTAAATNLCEFVGLAEETTRMAKTKTPDTQESTATPAPVATPEVSAQESAQVRSAAAAKAKAGERQRVKMIQRTAESLGLPKEFSELHVDGETSEEAFRALAFDEFEKRKAPIVSDVRPSIVPGEDRRDKWLRGATDWLIQRSSLSENILAAAEKRGETVVLDPGEFRGCSLLDLARESLDLAGVKHRGMGRMELVGLAMTTRSGMQGASDFGVLLENVMNKSLLAAYELEDDTWRRWCATGTVTDFRAHNRYRRGSFGTLDTVAEGGEFKNKAVADGRKESLTASTKGNIIAITRQAIINDDMGAFSSLAVEIGQMAGLSIEEDAYAVLALNGGLGPDMADTIAMFDLTAHANVGTTSLLTTAGLDADDALMGAQRDDNDKRFLSIKPSVLLVPRGLRMTAELLNDSQYEVDTSSRKAQIPNTVRGMFSDIIATPYLTGTRRYMFADPKRTPTIEVAFLDGRQAPYLEMRNGWTVDGVEWKVRMDYAVGGVDYKGALTNAGAAP